MQNGKGISNNCGHLIQVNKHYDFVLIWFQTILAFLTDREELLLQDCEWKIRETEKTCKDRIKAAEQLKQEAIRKAEKVSTESQTQHEKVNKIINLRNQIVMIFVLKNSYRSSI